MVKNVVMALLLVLAFCFIVRSDTPQQVKPFAEQPQKIEIQTGASVQAKHGICSAGASRTSEAGAEILSKGGNAFDGAAAALLMVGTGEQYFGLEVPIIFYRPETGKVQVLSGQGPAPALATWQHFYEEFENHKIPQSGRSIQNAAVPGLLLACLTMLKDYGTMSFAQVAEPMLGYLKAGERESQQHLGVTIEALIVAEKRALSAGGDRLAGLTAVRDYFYNGPIADRIETWMIENGGLIRKSDMAAYAKNWTPLEEPVSVDYKGYTVYKCDTWTQGPYMLQTLNLLEDIDLKSMGHNSVDYIHTLVESLKLGLADRDVYYADPKFSAVPIKQLLSKEYADLRRPLIDSKQASQVVRPGDPVNMKALLGSVDAPTGEWGPNNDTTTCIVADRWGNFVVTTPSGWGGVGEVGDTGVPMSCRLISLKSGWENLHHPNVVMPGKRPAITLTPTMVCKDGKPVIGISVAGGDMQDQCALNVLLNLIEFGFSPAEAVTVKRVGTEHHVNWFTQGAPRLGSINLPRGFDENLQQQLEARGHKPRFYGRSYGSPSMVFIDYNKQLFWGAGDAAARRSVAGY